jgi:hypothetical protein
VREVTIALAIAVLAVALACVGKETNSRLVRLGLRFIYNCSWIASLVVACGLVNEIPMRDDMQDRTQVVLLNALVFVSVVRNGFALSSWAGRKLQRIRLRLHRGPDED